MAAARGEKRGPGAPTFPPFQVSGKRGLAAARPPAPARGGRWSGSAPAPPSPSTISRRLRARGFRGRSDIWERVAQHAAVWPAGGCNAAYIAP